MKIVIYTNEREHQKAHANAMAAGLKRHGIEGQIVPRGVLSKCDIAIIWGYKPKEFVGGMESLGARLLLMERGFFPDRMKWTALSWDRLNNRGKLPECQDQGQRLESNWPGILKPWKEDGCYALICGQLPGDAALNGLNLKEWAQGVTNILVKQQGKRVRFRPHPWASDKEVCPVGAELSVDAPLEQDLAGAEFCVTFNSNSGVDAVLAGVPTVTLDAGATPWPVASHSLNDFLVRPDRYYWVNKLAWCQWKLSEIENGTAWETLRTVM